MSFVKNAISGVTGALGLTADPNVGQGSMQQATQAQQQAVQALQSVGIPPIEAQQIVLQMPELVLSSPEERLSGTAYEDISEDPRLRQTMMEALGELEDRGKTGLTTEDKARYQALQEMAGADEQARQEYILQQMAQRGALDSGAQLAAQLQSNQGQTNRLAQQGREMAAEAARARREALGQAANVAGQLSQQDYGRQAGLASAKDQIAAFNAAVSGRDTAAKQAQAQQLAALKNQQQMHNKALIQQKFQNEIARAGGVAGQLGNVAQTSMQQAAAQAQAAQNQAAGMRGIIGAAAPIAIGGLVGGPAGALAGAIGGKSLFKDGGIESGCEMGEHKKMGYEEGGIQTDGRVVPEQPHLPREMNYDGDNINDNINAGEMVLNLDQQQTISDAFLERNQKIQKLMEELEKLRADEAVAAGLADVNEGQQEALLNLAKGNIAPDNYPQGNIVEPSNEAKSKLAQLLNLGK